MMVLSACETGTISYRCFVVRALHGVSAGQFPVLSVLYVYTSISHIIE